LEKPKPIDSLTLAEDFYNVVILAFYVSDEQL
jgi:hypothetical protein